MDMTTALGSMRRKLKRAVSTIGQVRVHETDSGPTASAGTARVAVVLPVFNAMPYLNALLDSLAAQDLDPKLFEVIAVDDGSTDGGGALLDRFAAKHPNWRVIRQRNSGWPGRPRNIGIDASTSDYVFFCDADDIMAPEALRRMVAFSDAHQVDVLAPKMVGIGGRRVSPELYAKTAADVPLRKIFGTLSPQKLFRRELLDAHGIRFPEGQVRLEDGMMLARCYLAAHRTAILADYDYYFLRARDDGENISARRTNPMDYTESVSTIADIIRDNLPDPGMADLLVLDLYRRKVLRSHVPRRYRDMGLRRRSRWVAAHARFVDRHITVNLEEQLAFPFLQRSRLVRQRDAKALLHLAATEDALTQVCRAVPPSPGSSGLGLRLEPYLDYESVRLIARTRGSDHEITLELHPRGLEHATSLPLSELQVLGAVVVDLYVQLRLDGIDGPLRRVVAPAAGLPLELGGARLYATVKGSLSIDQRV